MSDFPLNWAFAYGEPNVTGLFRSSPEDFYVDENLGFEPEGTGEHVLLHVQKRGDNTAWLAKQIARLAGVKPSDVGYCGLKDRHAVTRQWFSIYFPKGEEPDWSQLNQGGTEVLEVSRHVRKLRPGSHQSNRFRITLRELEGDIDDLSQRLSRLSKEGVPNYFGEQRFGIEGNNLTLAQEILVDGRKIGNRQRRGMALSAARSYVFNSVLSERVCQSNWFTPVAGDVLVDERPTGPMWGRGRSPAAEESLSIEQAALADLGGWCDGMEHVGLSQERRPLCLKPAHMTWQLQDDSLVVEFELPPGSYATAVLRELCKLQNVSQPQGVV